MSIFQLYLKLGFQHISDFAAYDHMLFLISLFIIYQLRDWKKVFGLVTAFTMGHSITLALSVLDFILISGDIIEFFIPLTIFITSVSNIFSYADHPANKSVIKQFSFALVFGLIHGLGFSNYLKALMGEASSIIQPLFAFNIGLEIGQLLIVAIFLLLSYCVNRFLKIPEKYWILAVSIITALLSLSLVWENRFW